ncbi:hypothetical protein YC2023_095437 [Brassica napus]
MFDGLGGGDIGRKETTKRKIKGIDDALERILGFQYFSSRATSKAETTRSDIKNSRPTTAQGKSSFYSCNKKPRAKQAIDPTRLRRPPHRTANPKGHGPKRLRERQAKTVNISTCRKRRTAYAEVQENHHALG